MRFILKRLPFIKDIYKAFIKEENQNLENKLQPGKVKQNWPYCIAIQYWRAGIILVMFQKVSILNTELCKEIQTWKTAVPVLQNKQSNMEDHRWMIAADDFKFQWHWYLYWFVMQYMWSSIVLVFVLICFSHHCTCNSYMLLKVEILWNF